MCPEQACAQLCTGCPRRVPIATSRTPARNPPTRERHASVQIGVVPTDSYPALVCDLENADSAQMLAAVKDVSPSKPMSILVKDFKAVDAYTLGWPAACDPGALPPLPCTLSGHCGVRARVAHRFAFAAHTDGLVPNTRRCGVAEGAPDKATQTARRAAGMPDWFGVVRQVLPGPYTFILQASKAMPKMRLGGGKSKAKKSKQRHTVGVRMPDNAVCQELLSLLDKYAQSFLPAPAATVFSLACQNVTPRLAACRPLLCTSCSAHVEEGIETFSASLLMETYPDIDFVVDCGYEGAAASSVVDMTGGRPEVVRVGKGDVSMFEV